MFLNSYFGIKKIQGTKFEKVVSVMCLMAICRQNSSLAEAGIGGSGRQWGHFQSVLTLCPDSNFCLFSHSVILSSVLFILFLSPPWFLYFWALTFHLVLLCILFSFAETFISFPIYLCVCVITYEAWGVLSNSCQIILTPVLSHCWYLLVIFHHSSWALPGMRSDFILLYTGHLGVRV